MAESTSETAKFLPRNRLQELLDVLKSDGYDVIGPTVDSEAIVYRSILSVDQLPEGWTDRQQPAVYRLESQRHSRYFRFNVGPDAWKKYLFPPRADISIASLDNDGWHFQQVAEEVPKYALLGVRACDLAAIAVQDRVFMHDQYVDPIYRQRREAAIIIAVNCSTAQPTCFCTSMDTGPKCESGYDLCLTEVDNGFVIEVGSPGGATLINKLMTDEASETDQQCAEDEVAMASDAISKNFETHGAGELLLQNLEHPHWQSVAERCLSCTNCTMVCPTCFCSIVREVSNLRGDHVTRVRVWDSCFNLDMTYTADGTVRGSIHSRYRQWLTHKLATWEDQFDQSGCVGCGRCITWCPVGIDLTEEVDAIRSSQSAGA